MLKSNTFCIKFMLKMLPLKLNNFKISIQNKTLLAKFLLYLLYVSSLFRVKKKTEEDININSIA